MHEADMRILELLAEQGSDLSLPHHTLHYFYLPSQREAEAVASVLREDGCDNVVVDRAPVPFWKALFQRNRWSCIAEQSVILTEEGVASTSIRYSQLAEIHGGVYDGWEAGVMVDE